MPSQGPFAPGIVTDIAGGGRAAWTNPSNAAIDDGVSFATSSLTNSQDTDPLVGTNFGFSIPLSATILSVDFSYKGAITTGANGNISEESVFLYFSGTFQGTNQAANSLTTSLTQYIFSPGNTWGASLTPIIVNGSGFGAYLTWINNTTFTRALEIDAYQMTINYSLPPTKFFFLGGLDF